MSHGSITPNLQIYKAERFIANFFSDVPEGNIYLTIGRTLEWPDEPDPCGCSPSEYWYYRGYKHMLAGKKVQGTDVRHVINRNDWTPNTIYVQWDNTQTNNIGTSNANFYVVTSDWKVYKCLYNNNGANSTIEPTSTSTDVVETSDGYIWKFMYRISDAERLKFVTPNYIPVKTLISDDNSLQWDVQEAAVPGAIYATKMLTNGSGYTNANSVVVSIIGNGTGATAVANVNTISEIIESVRMTSYGSGYNNATIEITDTNGFGATANALLSPIGAGHGSDPLSELGGNKIMISTKLDTYYNPILASNTTFRQILLLLDPKKYGEDTIESNTTFSQTMKINLSGVFFDFHVGEHVYQGTSTDEATFIARVVSWDSANSRLELTDTNGTPTAAAIMGEESATTGFINSIEYPDLEPFTGTIIFINNMTAIERYPEQSEEFKIVLEF